MDAHLIQKVETALNGFEAFKTDLAAKAAKLDAFDEAKLNRISDAITAAAEEQQKADGRLKAVEDGQRALEAAVNRAALGGHAADPEELQAKRNRLFNAFARVRDDESKQYFHTYARAQVADEAELKALSVNADPSGGYLVTPEFGGVVQTRVYETSPLRQLAAVITVGTDQYEVILDNDQAASGWVGEATPRPDTDTPNLGKLVISVNELYASPKATQKLLDDAAVDMEGWLAGKVADKFARDEAAAFVSGNGVNKPKGVLSYPAGTDLAAQQVQQVNSGSAGAFTYDGLVDLQNALKEPYQANARFLMQRASNAPVMKLKDLEGRPIFNMTYDRNAGLEPTVLGKPVSFAADMPGVASAALAAAYGDFRQAYQVVDRAGIRVLRDPFTDKPFVKFYTTKRVGGAVVNFEAYKLLKLSA